jgi:hypothetical protein
VQIFLLSVLLELIRGLAEFSVTDIPNWTSADSVTLGTRSKN